MAGKKTKTVRKGELRGASARKRAPEKLRDASKGTIDLLDARYVRQLQEGMKLGRRLKRESENLLSPHDEIYNFGFAYACGYMRGQDEGLEQYQSARLKQNPEISSSDT
jgi:hypothetical protein